VFSSNLKIRSEASATMNLHVFWIASALDKTFSNFSPSLAFPCKEGVTEVKAQLQISAGESLIRFGVSNGQQVIQPNVRCY